MHRSRIGLGLWFSAAEIIISEHVKNELYVHIPARNLGALVGVSYETSHYLRQAIISDIELGGTGLLREAICVGYIAP